MIVLSCVLQSSDRRFGQTLAFSIEIEHDDSSQCTWDNLVARLHLWLRSKLIIVRNALLFYVQRKALLASLFIFGFGRDHVSLWKALLASVGLLGDPRCS